MAKAIKYEADGDAGNAPVATLDAGDTGDGASDQNAGDKGGDELTAPDWITSVPKEFRDNKALWKHSDFSSHLKESLENSDKLASFDPEKALTIPSEDASDDVREAFFHKLGKPETAEGYELNDPNFPEGLERSEELEGNLKQWAHKANISAESLKSLTDDYNAHMAEMFLEAQAAYDEDLQVKTDALKAEKKDGYNEFVLKAQRAATDLGGDEFIQLLKDSGGLEKHPTFLKVFGEIGSRMSEDTALGGGTGSGGGEEVFLGFDGKPRMTYDSDKKQE